MIPSFNELSDEIKHLIIRVLIPAFVGVSINIAVKMKNNRVTLLSALTSYTIGIGFAFLLSRVIQDEIGDTWHTALIGGVAISGEKIGNWIIYKFNFNKFADRIVDFLLRNLK